MVGAMPVLYAKVRTPGMIAGDKTRGRTVGSRLAPAGEPA